MSIEKIDGQLCIVFKADDSRFRGILGKVSSRLLKDVAANFQHMADATGSADPEIRNGHEARLPMRASLK